MGSGAKLLRRSAQGALPAAHRGGLAGITYKLSEAVRTACTESVSELLKVPHPARTAKSNAGNYNCRTLCTRNALLRDLRLCLVSLRWDTEPVVWCGQLWAFAWPQLMQASIVEPDVDSQKVVLEAIAESIEVHPKIRNQVQKTASASAYDILLRPRYARFGADADSSAGVRKRVPERPADGTACGGRMRLRPCSAYFI
eukprot:1409176-Rhodomonas_salina.10